MSKYLGIVIAFLSMYANAFEDLDCGGNASLYRDKESEISISICPVAEDRRHFIMTSVGVNYHTCNFKGYLENPVTKNQFQIDLKECIATIEIQESFIKFSRNGRCSKYYCGQRASWPYEALLKIEDR